MLPHNIRPLPAFLGSLGSRCTEAVHPRLAPTCHRAAKYTRSVSGFYPTQIGPESRVRAIYANAHGAWLAYTRTPRATEPDRLKLAKPGRQQYWMSRQRHLQQIAVSSLARLGVV